MVFAILSYDDTVHDEPCVPVEFDEEYFELVLTKLHNPVSYTHLTLPTIYSV